MLTSDVCLTSVCLSRTSGLSREQRGLGRPKLAQISHSFIQNCCCITTSFTTSRMNNWTLTSLILLMLTMLPSLCLISSKQTVSSNQSLCCYTGYLSRPKTKLQNMGADDPPSTILIDGVPVEGVEEFIYLGSKQSSNGYCRPDVLCRIGLACSVTNSLQRVWNCSSLFSQYQHQSTPVPSTDKVCSALRYRNIDPLGRRHEYTGGFPHEVTATDT